MAGRLDLAHVADVTQMCGERNGAVCLDVTGLLPADETGLEVLEALRARGVPLVGASPCL